MWQKVLTSDRNPNLIGKFVCAGRSTENPDTVFVRLAGERVEYEEDIKNLSKEYYKDAYGTIKFK